MAKIQFTIITDTGSPDMNDELFIVDQDESIVDTIQNIGISKVVILYEWQPQNDLNNTQIIDILKGKIAFGGKHFTAEGLRTIELEILDENDNSIGPAGLRTAIFIQEHLRDGISGIDQGDIIARSDIDVSEDVIYYSSFKQYPLTINLNTGKTL